MKPSLRVLGWSLMGGCAALVAASYGLGHPAPEFVPIAAKAGTVPTFNKDVAPILYKNCATCHRPGEVAPFSLLSYQDARKRARQIAMVTSDGFMPPWKADEGEEKFDDARRLTSAQLELLRRWSEAGAPEGNKADLPPAPKFTDGWQLGTPDAVLQPDAAYNLEAEGDDVYRCFVIPTNYDEDRYVAAMEVRPGNRPIVHHVIAYLDTTGRARQKDEEAAGPGYTSFGGIGVPPSGALGGWAPGLVSRRAPDGTGILLPKGADIVLQVHYHKSGKPETDLTKIGLYFAKGPVDKRIRTMLVVRRTLNIPAGEANYTTSASRAVPRDITVLSVTPHMHLLGKEMAVTASLPDGAEKKLVHVNDYDFNWQTIYAFKDPLKLPAGTRLNLTARYDNSTNNPANPTNPPKTVTWGEQTTDEMCIAFLNYTVDAEHLTQGQPVTNELPRGGIRPELMRQALELFDKNKNGQLDPDEIQTALKWWQENRETFE